MGTKRSSLLDLDFLNRLFNKYNYTKEVQELKY